MCEAWSLSSGVLWPRGLPPASMPINISYEQLTEFRCWNGTERASVCQPAVACHECICVCVLLFSRCTWPKARIKTRWALLDTVLSVPLPLMGCLFIFLIWFAFLLNDQLNSFCICTLKCDACCLSFLLLLLYSSFFCLISSVLPDHWYRTIWIVIAGHDHWKRILVANATYKLITFSALATPLVGFFFPLHFIFIFR